MNEKLVQEMNEQLVRELNMCEKDKIKDIEEMTKDMCDHGLGCGKEIATIAREIHPGALIILPLYRSCIVIEQSEEEKKEGVCTLHSYADPHWCGEEINIETLKSKEFHFEFLLQGDRQGPVIINKSYGEDKIDDEQCSCGNKDPAVLEQDEN